MHFYDPCTGSARVELVFPAGFAPPSAAQHTLPEFGKGRWSITEIAHIPCKAMGIFLWGLSLLSHDRNLSPDLFEEVLFS
jgi:hypothetical protein